MRITGNRNTVGDRDKGIHKSRTPLSSHGPHLLQYFTVPQVLQKVPDKGTKELSPSLGHWEQYCQGPSPYKLRSLEVRDRSKTHSNRRFKRYKLQSGTTENTYRSSTAESQRDGARTLRVRASDSSLTIVRPVHPGVPCNRGSVQETGGHCTLCQ